MPAGSKPGNFGVKPHKKNDLTIKQVEQAARCGLTAAEIAPLLNIHAATFWRHYKTEFQAARANIARSLSAKMIQRAMSDTAPPTVAQRAGEFVLERRFGWHQKAAIEEVGPGGLDDNDVAAEAMEDMARRFGIDDLDLGDDDDGEI